MSNFFNQVGQISQSFGQTLNTTFQQGVQATSTIVHTNIPASMVGEELRVGQRTVIVKEKIAEGKSENLDPFLSILTINLHCIDV